MFKTKTLVILLFLLTYGFLEFSYSSGDRARNSLNLGLSFYIEDDQEISSDSNFLKVIDGEDIFFRKKPIIKKENIIWYYPFKVEGNDNYGMTLKLNERGTALLHRASMKFVGHYLIPIAKIGRFQTSSMSRPEDNLRQFPLLIIDKPINNGLITIWSGIRKNDFKVINKYLKKYRKRFKFKKRNK